jgi:AraC-like DNA-binding protein
MERAADMLRSRGTTVREVAHRVGYRQPAQFAKAFRRHHGASPSAYRSRSPLEGFGDGSRIAPQPV